MHTRSRAAAATAVLLTASVSGLAAYGGTADAALSHPATHAKKTLTVTLTATKSDVKVSEPVIRPGNTLFKVKRGSAGGTLEVLRLKPGYTLQQAAADFGAALGSQTPDLQALARLDKNVVFYGGMAVPASKHGSSQFGVKIEKAGTYYVVNTDKNKVGMFQAKGKAQKRALPAADGWLNMKGSETFAAPKNDPHAGWMKTTNNADQPHFLEIDQVKESTTNQDIKDYFATGAQAAPPFALRGSAMTEIVSPGHTVVWKYAAPKGKYVALCFWPDKDTGMPHAFMGMWKLLHLV